MQHALNVLTCLFVAGLLTGCGDKPQPAPRRATARPERPAGPKVCPRLILSEKAQANARLTRRVKAEVCGLQPCFDAAADRVKKKSRVRLKLWVTIDQGGHVEAVKVRARNSPENLTWCVRKKILRWDFDIRDESYTYGPFQLRFAK